MLSHQDEFGVPIMRFERVDDFTTFTVEYAMDGRDIVFHFFKTAENNSPDYWRRVFPAALQEVAQEVWEATYPRLKAAFTEEMDSWWLRAFGFADVGDPLARIQHFVARLDQTLDTMSTSACVV